MNLSAVEQGLNGNITLYKAMVPKTDVGKILAGVGGGHTVSPDTVPANTAPADANIVLYRSGERGLGLFLRSCPIVHVRPPLYS